MKKKVIVIFSGIIILIIVGAYFVLFATRDSGSEIISDFKEKVIDKTNIYPDTQKAPVLELTWSGELDPKDATRYTPYGVWEAQMKYPEGVVYEPANEMQFYVQTDEEDYLAAAPGIVTQNELHGKSGLITVRYGENYAITYLHIIPAKNLKTGTKVETGDILGKMEKMSNPTWSEETWWEIQVTKKEGNKFRTMPPYNYFSKAGKEKLNAIAAASREKNHNWISAKGSNGWTVVDGCSWIKYTKEPSWWNSNRFTFEESAETEEEFIGSLGLGWKVGDNQGRIIGPTDKCD